MLGPVLVLRALWTRGSGGPGTRANSLVLEHHGFLAGILLWWHLGHQDQKLSANGGVLTKALDLKVEAKAGGRTGSSKRLVRCMVVN